MSVSASTSPSPAHSPSAGNSARMHKFMHSGGVGVGVAGGGIGVGAVQRSFTHNNHSINSSSIITSSSLPIAGVSSVGGVHVGIAVNDVGGGALGMSGVSSSDEDSSKGSRFLRLLAALPCPCWPSFRCFSFLFNEDGTTAEMTFESRWAYLVYTLGDNFLARAVAIFLIGQCAFIALTARGVTTIIHAVVGVIFAIEGFWGATKRDGDTIKRFLIFLLCHFCASIVIAIIELQTIDQYCQSATNQSDFNSCSSTAYAYAWSCLGLGLGLVPILFVLELYFYRLLLINQTHHYQLVPLLNHTHSHHSHTHAVNSSTINSHANGTVQSHIVLRESEK